MKKPILGRTGKQLLRAVHIIISGIWLGSGISMIALMFIWPPTVDSDVYSVNHAAALINGWVTVPSAFGSLLTGLLESWLTNWGFLKYRWVILKWAGTSVLIIYGAVFHSNLERSIESIAKTEGLRALQNPIYIQNWQLYTLSAIGIVATLAALSIVSALKPWAKKAEQDKNFSEKPIK